MYGVLATPGIPEPDPTCAIKKVSKEKEEEEIVAVKIVFVGRDDNADELLATPVADGHGF
jgi:hypothetical protein